MEPARYSNLRTTTIHEFVGYLASPLCSPIALDSLSAGDVVQVRNETGEVTSAYTFITNELVFTKNGTLGAYNFSNQTELLAGLGIDSLPTRKSLRCGGPAASPIQIARLQGYRCHSFIDVLVGSRFDLYSLETQASNATINGSYTTTKLNGPEHWFTFKGKNIGKGKIRRIATDSKSAEIISQITTGALTWTQVKSLVTYTSEEKENARAYYDLEQTGLSTTTLKPGQVEESTGFTVLDQILCHASPGGGPCLFGKGAYNSIEALKP